ncbi:MAG: hypothetical protein ABUL71_05570 [Gemmatimonadota bacterium]
MTVGDALRQRLQLVLGLQVTLGDEVASPVGGRCFAATSRETGQAVTVTVHRAPPDGPDPDALHRRLVELRTLGHPLLDLPMSDGEFNNHVWVIEAVSPLPAMCDRLDDGPLSLLLAVSVIRDIARTLVAMHRRGFNHGFINPQTVRISDSGARLGGLGLTIGGSVRGDLDALGVVAWSLLSGESVPSSTQLLSKVRRGVPRSLDALCASFCARNPADRPQRAEDVLDALDAVPIRRSNAFISLVDASMHDGRPQRAFTWLVVGVAILLLVALLQSRL